MRFAICSIRRRFSLFLSKERSSLFISKERCSLCTLKNLLLGLLMQTCFFKKLEKETGSTKEEIKK